MKLNNLINLTEYKNNKVCILGIGNPVRGDDYAGSFIANKLNSEIDNPNILIIASDSTPENYTSQIINFSPEVLILIDACKFQGYIGEIRKIDISEISNSNLSTHSLSIEMMIKYIKIHISNLEILFLGIQPKQLQYGEKISTEVQNSCQEIIKLLTKNFNT